MSNFPQPGAGGWGNAFEGVQSLTLDDIVRM